jgi:hypothetical protein
MKKAREPLDTEQAIGRRRCIEPAEWYVGRHADATVAHRPPLAPRPHVVHRRGNARSVATITA